MRAVIDTSIFFSALIRRKGTIGALLRALRDGHFTVIYATAILIEIIDWLGRDKFRIKYHLEPNDITALVNLIRLRGELVIPAQSITAYRDPKDNKFLEAALAGAADYIVSGDANLLDLESFESIPILHPAAFLARL